MENGDVAEREKSDWDLDSMLAQMNSMASLVLAGCPFAWERCKMPKSQKALNVF